MRSTVRRLQMRILIVKLSSIGDVVHTLPAAAYLKSRLPDAHISWAVELRASQILTDSPAIDELIVLDRWTSARSQLGRSSPRGQFDVAIDFQGLVKSGLVALTSRAPARIGLDTADLREKAARFFLTRQVDTTRKTHVIEKNLSLAVAVTGEHNGAPPGPPQFPIAMSAEDERYAERVICEHGSTFAILNPGGGWPTKLWPAAPFGQIADWLFDEHGMRSLVTFGPGEELLAQAVAEASRAKAAVLLPSTLKQFTALARRAALFVGGDTGPLHIAAACGTPIVGLYGPTSPARNGPFNPEDVTLGRDLWCRTNCHKRSCWHWECMCIPVSTVQRAIEERLSRTQQPSRKLMLEVP